MIKFITSATKLEGYPQTDNEVVFVGRSNVGKSSLINTLYGKVAYVGKTPGKTKLLNFFNVDNKYTVCDVPGYGYSKLSNKEMIDFGRMMDTYFESRKELRLCILILDIRRVPNDDDKEMYEYLNEHNIPTLFVLNKADKLSNNEINNQLNVIIKALGIEKENCIITSVLKRKNIEDLKDIIENCVYEQGK